MVLAHRLFERFERLVDSVLLQKDFRRSCPDHHHAGALVVFFQFCDLID